MACELLRYDAGAWTALGTPFTSDTLIGLCLYRVTKSSLRVTHMGYDVHVSPSTQCTACPVIVVDRTA